MIIGVGIDFVEINRIELVFKKWGSVFSRKILSKKELHFFSSYENSRLPFLAITYLAKRFAAKEALAKSIGTGFRNNLNFKDIQILNDKIGKPYYQKSKKIDKIINNEFKVKAYDLFLSISDEKDYSIAFTIIQKK